MRAKAVYPCLAATSWPSVLTAVTVLAAASAARAENPPHPARVDAPHSKLELHPECGTMMYFGEGMGAGMSDLFDKVGFLADLILPHVGLRYEHHRGSALALSWPLVFSFGQPTVVLVRHYHCSEDAVRELKPHRLAVEPGVAFGTQTLWSIRPSYGYVWHPEKWRVGVQVDIGPTLSRRNAGNLFAVGPELALRYGGCCTPMHIVLAIRYEAPLSAKQGQTSVNRCDASCARPTCQPL